MLIHEGTSGFGVALHAYHIARDTAVQAFLFECSMRIVAIAAVHQPLVHFVMKRLRESWLYIRVAAIAELWLRNFEKALLARKFVNAMATCTAHSGFPVCGSLKIRMCRGMTLQTLFVHLLGCGFAESEDFLHIAAAFDMFSTRPVTGFAGDTLSTVQHGETRVWILGELLVYVLMAGLAGFRSDKIRRIRSAGFLGMCRWRLLVRSCGAYLHCSPKAEQAYEKHHAEQHTSHLSLQKEARELLS